MNLLRNRIPSKLMSGIIKTIRLIVNVFLILLSFIVISMFILSNINSKYMASTIGFEMRKVLSDSMQGTIDKGSIIVSSRTSAQELESGDIITFSTNYFGQEKIITHRIISKTPIFSYDSFTYSFKTKGDNNPAPDPFTITSEDIISKFQFIVPGSEFLSNKIIPYLKTPIGIATAVISGVGLVGGVVILNLIGKELSEKHYHSLEIEVEKHEKTVLNKKVKKAIKKIKGEEQGVDDD